MLNKSKFIDSRVMEGAIFNNSYSMAVPAIHSIGLVTHSLRYQGRHSLTYAAEDFLLNSRLYRNYPENDISILNYLDDVGATMLSFMGQEDISNFSKMKLPEGVPLDLALGEAIALRRSVRHYTGDFIGLDYVATILRAGQGMSCESEIQLVSDGATTMRWRTTPSAGGLYPIEIYLMSLKIRNLARGLYRYHSYSDSLLEIGNEQILKETLKNFAMTEEQIALSQANMVIFLVAQPWKTMRKYGARGLRYVLHEGGAISQNIHLATTGLGLGSVDCASFYDDDMNQVLGIDGKLEMLTHTIIIGTQEI